MPLLQIIYASAAAPTLTQTELENLLARARLKNSRLGITGILLHHEGTFLQVIEGPPDTVQGLFAKIIKDPRHTHVVLLLRRAVEAPSFEGWHVGFVNAERHDLEKLPGFFDYNRALTVPLALLNADVAWRVLEGFRNGNWRQCVEGGTCNGSFGCRKLRGSPREAPEPKK
ncbi:BLUF domain-containing protein [Frigoriglobus tundricola]|uniref:BLUF domain-containing protein n=1 Tax=Frigoriglobus tundricola TaxID=2774151 RepID=A0A6M5YWJ9_9BACT|nr:BLUF domain-containing protein [Frigoriglobus tundricola]QJW98308.1 hypothetical protein FTUN_5896 [Frigoriglobus tundricola]